MGRDGNSPRMKTPRPSILTFALGLCAFTGIAHAGLPVAKPMGKPMPSLQPMVSRFNAVPLPDSLVAKLPKTAQDLDAKLGGLGKWSDTKPQKGWKAPPIDLPDWNGKKVLIVFQENTGSLSSLPEGTPPDVRARIETVVDQVAETFEDMKNDLQGAGRYDKVVLLTDANCTRAQLVANLASYSKKNATIDLIVLGHGTDDGLVIHGDDWLLGAPKYPEDDTRHIRRLDDEARALGADHLNLRLVFMCNCRGATVADDWRAIGAKVVVASQGDNYMPEPMTSFFVHDWLAGETAGFSATFAYQHTIPFYALVFPPVATTAFETQNVSTPCGSEWVDNGCSATNPVTRKSYNYGCYKVKMCTETVQVPVGVNLSTHPHVESSKLVVAGESGLRFGNTL